MSSPMKVIQELACPTCGRTDALSTIETLTGLAPCTVTVVDGAVDVEYDGYTDVLWETSITLGVTCKCGFEHEGDDWEDQLLLTGDKEVGKCECCCKTVYDYDEQVDARSHPLMAMEVADLDGVVLCAECFYDRERYEAVLAAQAGV